MDPSIHNLLTHPQQPFEIDYIQTFFTLCDILCEVYHKMLINTNGGVCTQSFCETVLKIDGRFKVSWEKRILGT